MSASKDTRIISEKKYSKEERKIIPPEGGWGYFVCIGFVLVFVPVFAYKSCYGMIFNGFLEDLGEGISGFSVVSGIWSTMLNTSGILTSVLLKKFSLRKVGFFGGAIYICGMFGNCFITSVNQMIISIGILQGTGCGILISIGFTSFNQYFLSKRLMVMSTTKIFCALGVMVYPMMVKGLMQEYGLLGTNLIATAIDLHLFLGVALMQPIKWHQSREEKSLPPIDGQTQLNQIKMTALVQNGNNIKVNDYQEKIKISVGEESEKLLSTTNVNISDILQRTDINQKNIGDTKKDGPKYENSLSIHQVKEIPEETDKKQSKWDVIVRYFDLDLFKDYVFVNIACGMSIGMNTEAVFYMLLPLYLYFINFTMGDVALCLSVVSAGDFVSRIVISIVSGFCHFKSRSLFFYGLLASVIFKTTFIYVHSLTGILILCGVLGFCRGCMHIPISLVYAEYSTEKFTAAYGLGHVLSAVCSALITPIFGIFKDVTGSYTVPFYVNIVITLFCIIPWTLEFWYESHKNKKMNN